MRSATDLDASFVFEDFYNQYRAAFHEAGCDYVFTSGLCGAPEASYLDAIECMETAEIPIDELMMKKFLWVTEGTFIGQIIRDFLRKYGQDFDLDAAEAEIATGIFDHYGEGREVRVILEEED